MFVSQFIAAVRRQGSIAQSTVTTDINSDAGIMATGDMEIQGRILPLLRSVQQEYLVRELTANSVGGRVTLPARAVTGSVRQVQCVVGGVAYGLQQASLEEDYLIATAGQPYGFYFDGGGIVLLPRGTDGSIRLRYYARPGKMCLETDTATCQPITAVSYAANGDATLTIPGLISGLVGGIVDVISAGPAHEHLAINAAVASSTSPVILAASQPGNRISSGLYTNGGDYLVIQDRTPFVPIPEELFAPLVHQTAAVIQQALGYLSEAQAQRGYAEATLQESLKMLMPRSAGNPKILTNGIRALMGASGRSSRIIR